MIYKVACSCVCYAPGGEVPIAGTSVNTDFDLVLLVQDIRPEKSYPWGTGQRFAPRGVFSLYADILFNEEYAAVRGVEVQSVQFAADAPKFGTFRLMHRGKATTYIAYDLRTPQARLTTAQNIQTRFNAVQPSTDWVSVTPDPVFVNRFILKFLSYDIDHPTVMDDRSYVTIKEISSGSPESLSLRDACTFHPVYPNGRQAKNGLNLIDSVGAFAGMQPTGVYPYELARFRMKAKTVGGVSFTPYLENQSIPAEATLVYGMLSEEGTDYIDPLEQMWVQPSEIEVRHAALSIVP